MEILPLEPLHFFEISFDLPLYKGKREEFLSKHFRMPELSSFLEDGGFAKCFLGWSEEGIFFDAQVESRKLAVFFPDFRKGDSVELFIDTRDMKNVDYTHKFCHHFVFLPKAYDDEGDSIQAKEVTKFRGDEHHELADPSLLLVEVAEEKKGYTLHVFIPSSALFGFDPLNFNRMGFTYRINRSYGPPQYFSTSGEECLIEQHPILWSTAVMKG